MNKIIYFLNQDKFDVRQMMINWAGKGKKVLEVGCGSGKTTKELVEKRCQVTGIEIDTKRAIKAAKYCKEIIIGDIEERKTLKKIERKKFEVIILMEVLEHLKNPGNCLVELGTFLGKKGKMIISVPNIAFLTNRLWHLLGRFDYTDSGIMAKTHLIFFTKKTILRMVKSSGLEVIKFDWAVNFTQLPLFMSALYPLLGKRKWWRRIEYKIGCLWPEGLAIQYFLVCQKREDLKK